MFFLCAVVSCIPFVFGSEGRTVQGILGRNVSLSWTLNNTKRDSFSISRNSTDILMVWPLKNLVVPHVEDERLQVYVENSTYETLTITVSISSIRDKDAGIYKLERRWDSEDFNDSVILQIDETNRPWITMTRHHILDSFIELQCSSLNISAGNVAWMLNGSLIESHGRYSQHNTLLSIQNVTAADKYNVYTCYQSGGGSESDTYRLNIPQSSIIPSNGNNVVQRDFNDLLGPLLGVALVIVAISLIIVGILILVTQSRKHAFNRIASGTMHQPSAESSNREVTQEFIRFENHYRNLTIPIVQDNAYRSIGRSGYPVVNRISTSFRTLMNHTQPISNPLRQALSLQTLQTLTQLSYAIRSRVQNDDLLSATCCSETYSLSSMEGSAKGTCLDELSSRALRDSRVSHDEQNTGARSLSLNNFSPQSFHQQPEEDQYSTIDEASLSAYQCVKINYHDETLQAGRSPEDGDSDIDFAILPALEKP